MIIINLSRFAVTLVRSQQWDCGSPPLGMFQFVCPVARQPVANPCSNWMYSAAFLSSFFT